MIREFFAAIQESPLGYMVAGYFFLLLLTIVGLIREWKKGNEAYRNQ